MVMWTSTRWMSPPGSGYSPEGMCRYIDCIPIRPGPVNRFATIFMLAMNPVDIDWSRLHLYPGVLVQPSAGLDVHLLSRCQPPSRRRFRSRAARGFRRCFSQRNLSMKNPVPPSSIFRDAFYPLVCVLYIPVAARNWLLAYMDLLAGFMWMPKTCPGPSRLNAICPRSGGWVTVRSACRDHALHRPFMDAHRSRTRGFFHNKIWARNRSPSRHQINRQCRTRFAIKK